MKILAIDPGETTGIAHASVDRTWQIVTPVWAQLDTYDPFAGAALLLNMLEELRPDILVVEDFIPRTLAANLQPMTIIHIVRWEVEGDGRYLTDRPSTLALQQPSERSVINDTRLKRLELYQPGMPHANDAMRHLVVKSRKLRVDDGRRTE